MTDIGTIKLEDRKILFRNFSGKDGKRNFSVVLTKDEAAQMASRTWQVREHLGENGPQYVLRVYVSDSYPEVEKLAHLDMEELVMADVTICTYEYWPYLDSIDVLNETSVI